MARALNSLPPVDAVLNGDKPHLGFGILVCTASSAMFRVIFESINEGALALSAHRTPSQRPASMRPGQTAAGGDD